MNPQEDRLFFFLGSDAAAMSSLRVTSQQPYHSDVGLCDGGHLWLRHTGIRPSQYENPTLHRGVVGSSLWDFGLTHCHRLRPADGGGCNLPRCQCSHSFRLKSYFFLFFSLYSPSFCIFAIKYRLNSGAILLEIT